jgi:hypothetical protein
MNRLGLMVAALLAAAPAGGAPRVVVEDWSRQEAGARGVPGDWTGQNWGDPRFDFTIIVNDEGNGLHLKSRDEGSTISKDISGKVDLRATPVLEWRWKVVQLPAGGHSCRAASDDQAAQVYVLWPRFPEPIRSRIIGYVWDSTAPVGTVCKSEKTSTVTYIVVRSGPAELGRWITERRNVWQDFKQVYGETPDAPAAVSVSIDTNDTHSVAEAFIGPIVFRAP